METITMPTPTIIVEVVLATFQETKLNTTLFLGLFVFLINIYYIPLFSFFVYG
jgi:hypothetical protein